MIDAEFLCVQALPELWGVLFLGTEERFDICRRDETQRDRNFTEMPLVASCLCAYDLIHLSLIHCTCSDHVIAHSL